MILLHGWAFGPFNEPLPLQCVPTDYIYLICNANTETDLAFSKLKKENQNQNNAQKISITQKHGTYSRSQYWSRIRWFNISITQFCLPMMRGNRCATNFKCIRMRMAQPIDICGLLPYDTAFHYVQRCGRGIARTFSTKTENHIYFILVHCRSAAYGWLCGGNLSSSDKRLIETDKLMK